MLDKCQSNGNDYLSNFNTLETICCVTSGFIVFASRSLSRGGVKIRCYHVTW